MSQNKIKVMLEEGVTLPKFESKLAAGVDIRGIKILAAYKGDIAVSSAKLAQMHEGFTKRQFIKIRAFERVLFGTGVRVQLPEDMELQVRPRSGMTLKKGLTVINSPGTIDADYRGEIGIILYNSSPFMTEVKFNERIAQLVPKPTIQPDIIIEQELSSTERGEGGFGSTDACGLFLCSNTASICDTCGRHESEHTV